MKKSNYIKLVLVSGIMAACSNQNAEKDARLYNRLNVRTDTGGVYTTGESAYDLYPYGDVQDQGYYGGAFYYRIGYGSGMLAPHSSIEMANISRGGFGSSSFHVST